MVGTVVHQELLLGSRRNRLHVFRWVYGGWLILQVFWLYLQFEVAEQARYSAYYPWWSGMPLQDLPPFIWRSAPHVVGGWFADTFVRQQFVLLAIATPALVAGAITDEKRRGTLQHLLVADIDTRPLLLGKLLGRVTQVAVLALAGLPLYALLAGFGGVGPAAVLAFGALSAVTVLAVASAALLASVWCRQTRDAVLALYAAGLAGGLAVWWSGGVLDGFSPSWVLEPGATDPAETFRRLGLATLCWGSLGGACLGLAVWRLKPAYLRELEGAPAKKPGWRAGSRAAVDDEPVRWRERHVEGLAPAAGLRRVPQWLAVAGVALASAASSALILALSLAPGASLADVGRALARADFVQLEKLVPGAAGGFLLQGVAVLLLGSLVVAVRCSGSVTGERERQTWEPLLLTPLSARELVRGKLWGVMGASYVYLLAYGMPAAALAVVAGPLAVCWVVLWLGVTVLAMYFVGAAGLWSSVRSKSSWQALLKTLAWGYLGAAVLYLVTSPLLLFIYLLILLALWVAESYLRIPLVKGFANNFSNTSNMILVATCISLALIFWLAARQFMNWAWRWIADRERTRHWHSAPVYRRAKRRARDKVTG
jgi:ABC-type transport system involved in multi-copper enzyme maturation permease subunit